VKYICVWLCTFNGISIFVKVSKKIFSISCHVFDKVGDTLKWMYDVGAVSCNNLFEPEASDVFWDLCSKSSDCVS